MRLALAVWWLAYALGCVLVAAITVVKRDPAHVTFAYLGMTFVALHWSAEQTRKRAEQ